MTTGVVLLVLGRQQYFSGDEWAFLGRRGMFGAEFGLFHPHNEHWSTTPVLIYRSLYNVFGVESYLPYFIVLVVLHLAATHLLWRLVRRAGVADWVALAFTVTFAVGGGGAENLMWAFQIGFVGSLALGLLLLLLVDDPDPGSRKSWAAVALSLFMLTWSGMSVPMIMTAAALAWMRTGWRGFLRLAFPSALTYGLWLILAGGSGLETQATGSRDMLLAPAFVWRGLTHTFDSYTLLVGGGPVVVLFVAALLVRQSARPPGPEAVAIACAAGALLVYATVAPGRVSFGLGQAEASRYHYLAWALLVPALGFACTELLGRIPNRSWALVIFAFGCAAGGLNQLVIFARGQEGAEQQFRRRLGADLALVLSGAPTFPVAPDPIHAPDLAPPDRMAAVLTKGGFAVPDDLSPEELLTASAQFQIRVGPQASLAPDLASPRVTVSAVSNAALRGAAPGCLTIEPAGPGLPDVSLAVTGPSGLMLEPGGPGEVRIRLVDPRSGKSVDAGVSLPVQAGVPARLDLATTRAVAVLSLPAGGSTTICGVASVR